MATVQAKNVKLEIETAPASGVYAQLCATDFSLDLAIETDNITDMCSNNWTETSSQIRTASLSLNGVFESTSTAYSALKTSFLSTTANLWGTVLARATDADGDVWSGTLQINSLGQSAAYNQDVRFSLDAAFSGAVSVA